MEIKWGLMPDMSASQTLRDLVRLDVAKELTFTGRVVKADEAISLVLVTRIEDDPVAAALDMARTIVGHSPDAVTVGKCLMDNAWHGDTMDGLKMEEKLQGTIIGKDNHLESITAALEGREPKFTPPPQN